MIDELSQIQEDWERIRTTTFWKAYVDKMKDQRAHKSRLLETTGKESVEKIQGYIEGLDFMKRIPDDITSGKKE